MKAPCSYFRACPGCTTMQFPYVKQVRDKYIKLKRILDPVLRSERDDVLRQLVQSPSQLGYRTSTKLVLSEDRFGDHRVGLFARATKKVVNIPGCPVHHPEINKILSRMWGDKAPPPPAPFYNHESRVFQPGRCKYVTIRYCPENRSAAVILSHTGIPRTDLENWVALLGCPNVSFHESLLGRLDGKSVLSDDAHHISGPKEIPFTIGCRTFRLGPLAFFQANGSLTSAFVSSVTEGLAGDELLDLYGGFGAYSFMLAASFNKIRLVDANPHAINAARLQAVEERTPHVFPVAASVEDDLYKLGSKGRHVTDLIVNPPRGGLSPRAKLLIRQRLPNLQTLTYVSCNPETLVRDLKELVSPMALRVQTVTPFDMFPQTNHVETVVRLVRR